MARSLFAANQVAAHRAIRRVLGGANDSQGRQLFIWWPATNIANKRLVTEANCVAIPAFIGPSKRDAVAAMALAVIPQNALTFAAESASFPAATPPREGMCFLAGPSYSEATFYRCTRATSVNGLVEIEAAVEQ